MTEAVAKLLIEKASFRRRCYSAPRERLHPGKDQQRHNNRFSDLCTPATQSPKLIRNTGYLFQTGTSVVNRAELSRHGTGNGTPELEL